LRKSAYLLFFLPSLLFADDVILKGGAKFTGRIVEQNDKMVTVDIGSGVVGVPMSRVEKITKGHSALDEYDARAAKLKEKDAAGWRDLGRWASQQGLSAQSRLAYQNVLAVSPNDAEAREAMGFVQLDGRWVTEEESYRARGFVQYDGEWMTREDAQAAQASADADAAREAAAREANIAKAEEIQSAARAEKAEERARRDASQQTWDFPLSWGGWGYGVTTWPSNGLSDQWPPNRPTIPSMPSSPGTSAPSSPPSRPPASPPASAPAPEPAPQ
jgi:hypothetical protein